MIGALRVNAWVITVTGNEHTRQGPRFIFTVLADKSDSDVMFCLYSYQ